MRTVVGPVLDQLGMACQSRFSTEPEHFWQPVRHKTWVSPASEVRSVQAASVPVNFNHRSAQTVGHVIYFERSAGFLWAVAHVNDAVDPGEPCYWSAEAEHGHDGSDVEITGLGIVAKSAQIGLGPLTFLDGALDYRGATQRWALSLPSRQRELLERAAASNVHRRHGDALTVHDLEQVGGSADRPQRSGGLEVRSATTTNVARNGRTIELVVMPYERDAVVAHHGRMVREVCSRDAFDQADLQRDRVRVNRDHDLTRTVGAATWFDTHDPRGLVAELRISPTQLGDETLQLADDGVLDASAGFRVVAETWETSERRRIKRAWLHHIALTPDPAYHDATVLAVRTGERRPNLERVLAGLR